MHIIRSCCSYDDFNQRQKKMMRTDWTNNEARTIKTFSVICWTKPRYRWALTSRGKREGFEKWLDVLLKPSRGFTAAARSLISKKPPCTSRRSTSWIRADVRAGAIDLDVRSRRSIDLIQESTHKLPMRSQEGIITEKCAHNQR